MLKKSYRCALLLTVGLSASTPLIVQAQTIIGMGTDNPNPNAVLELVPEKGNQGFLAPRLNSAQRNASSFTTKLTDADNGLLVFDTEEGQFFYWYRGEWRRGVSSGQGGSQPVNHGTTWYTGATEPRGINASEGDFYIDESTGEVYKFSNLSFAIIGSLGESANPNRTQNLAEVLQQSNSAASLKISDLGEPTEANDAVTKEYVDQLVGRTPPIVDLDNQSLSNVLGIDNDANRTKIINLEHPDDPRDAATKEYVDDEIDNLAPLFGTDNQQLSFNTATNRLSIEDGNEVDLSSLDGGFGGDQQWYDGTNDPNIVDPTGSQNGDYYYRTAPLDEEKVYRKVGGSWQELGGFTSTKDVELNGKTYEYRTPWLYSGPGKPKDVANDVGKPGDFFYSTTEDKVYFKKPKKDGSSEWDDL